MNSLLDQPQTEAEQRAEHTADAVGLAWCSPLIRTTSRLCTPEELARWLRCNRQFIYDTLHKTECLETVGLRSHYRITTRSALVWAWESWSGRAKATHRQILVFVLALLRHLPTVMLRVIGDACHEAIERRKLAEKAVGLEITAASPAEVRAAFANGKRIVTAATKSGQTQPPPKPKSDHDELPLKVS